MALDEMAFAAQGSLALNSTLERFGIQQRKGMA